MSRRLQAEGALMHEFCATTQNFSPAIIEPDAAMQSGRLRHDGDPVSGWCRSNVVGNADMCGNGYPTTAQPDQKIDAAVAVMTAIGRAVVCGFPTMPSGHTELKASTYSDLMPSTFLR